MDFKKEAQKPLVTDEHRVEIIMLTIYNDRDVAGECVKAIFQHVKYPFKLTVYDNSLNSLNTAKVWNKLIRESTCGYICLIDSDAVPKNDFITELLSVLMHYPDAAAAGPAGDETSDVNHFQQGMYDPNGRPIPMYDNLSGFCFMFRKSIMEEYGYFNEDFVFYGQDSEWTHRMALIPKILYVVPKAYVNHGISVSSSRKEKESHGTDFSRIRDVAYAQRLLGAYRNISYKEYNPWKHKFPYFGLAKLWDK